MKFLLVGALTLVSVTAQQYQWGLCGGRPGPMVDFEWDKFAKGVWFVTRKVSSNSSCLTYQFKTDTTGRSLEQVRQVAGSDKELVYTGGLSLPRPSARPGPASMSVRFPLNVIGAADLVVVDTDYDNYALICICQDLELFFTYGHRRSCSIMQRNSIEDAEITKKMEELLQDDSDPLVFDKISHDGCGKYKERVNIESDLLDMESRDLVNSLASEIEFDSLNKTTEDIKNDALNLLSR